MGESVRSRYLSGTNARPESIPSSTSSPPRTARKPSSKANAKACSDLQLDQPVRRFRQDGELGKFPANHRDFVAAMKSRAHVAVLVYLVGKILALCDRKAHAGEKLRAPRKKTDAADTMLLRFGKQRFHQSSASALALRPRRNGDGADFRQVCPVQMECAAPHDSSAVFHDTEIPDIFTELGQRARQKCAVAGGSGDQLVNLIGVGQDRFTRAHVVPHAKSQLSSLPRQLLAARAPARFRQARRGSLGRKQDSENRKNPDQTQN